jgi:hypothetical protein
MSRRCGECARYSAVNRRCLRKSKPMDPFAVCQKYRPALGAGKASKEKPSAATDGHDERN